MPRFAANLSMLYTEWDFLDRFAAAAEDGFAGVECLFPYEHPAAEVAARLQGAGLVQALFNAPPGDWTAGEKGLATLPGREDEFRRAIDTALEYARHLRCASVHVMAGLLPEGASAAERAARRALYVENLAWAARQAAPQGVTLMIEPINTRDIPGYFLNRQDEAHAIRAEVGAPNLKVQMDFYHCQIVEGDLIAKLRRWVDGIGHMQVAGVPERHEPDAGLTNEVNYFRVFEAIDEAGYRGWVGCEYRPRAGTRAGLGWLHAWRAQSSAERPAR